MQCKALSFVYSKIQKEDDFILYRAAVAWNELLNYQYIITYGKKKKLYKTGLSFTEREFPHLVGIQYAKDIVLPKLKRSNFLREILAGNITDRDFAKAEQYEAIIKGRMEVVANLKELLESDFRLFLYRPMLYNFATTIKADYVISGNFNNNSFVFLIKANRYKVNDLDYVCTSAFKKGDRDYEYSQPQLKILKKERVCLETGEVTVLEDKLKNKLTSKR